MGLREKVIDALRQPLNAEYIRLEDDDGLSGFVVSRQFDKMSSLDRQELIDAALDKAPEPLTVEERRQVLIIAGLAPGEYASVGTRIRVHKIREMAGGAVEVLLHGGWSDAEYVREALNNQKGVRTGEPKQEPGAIGVLMSFRARGTTTDPLTKAKVVRVLKGDPYIEVMTND